MHHKIQSVLNLSVPDFNAYDEFKSDFEKAISGNMTVELKQRISEMDQALMKANKLEIAIVVMPATVETAIAFPEHGVGLLIGAWPTVCG